MNLWPLPHEIFVFFLLRLNWAWNAQVSKTLTHVLSVCVLPGNVFVIAAVFVEKNLQNSVANYLIVSLAVADLMVACLVMPLGALYEVKLSFSFSSSSSSSPIPKWGSVQTSENFSNFHSTTALTTPTKLNQGRKRGKRGRESTFFSNGRPTHLSPKYPFLPPFHPLGIIQSRNSSKQKFEFPPHSPTPFTSHLQAQPIRSEAEEGMGKGKSKRGAEKLPSRSKNVKDWRRNGSLSCRTFTAALRRKLACG